MLSFLGLGKKPAAVPKLKAKDKNNRTQLNRVCVGYNSSLPGVYQLENFHNRGVNPQNSCLPGFYPADGIGVPQNASDVSSQLRHEQKLTNLREINQVGQLPFLTIPDVSRGCHDVSAETSLIQGEYTNKSNACIPRDSNYIPGRRFEIFDNICYQPNDHAVEPFRRAGVDTRHDRARFYCGPRRSSCRCTRQCVKCRGNCGDDVCPCAQNA